MHYKKIIIPFLVLFSFNLLAQSENNSAEKVESKSTFKVFKKKKRYKYFSENAPVTMADGSVKAIANVKAGDNVKTCRNGKSVITQVKHIEIYEQTTSSLTAVYLRPTEAPLNTAPFVPALLLEATPDHLVQTKKGKKRMNRLSKNDILYHYEPTTGVVSTWKVGVIHENARRVAKAYNLTTEEGTYLVDNMIMAQ